MEPARNARLLHTFCATQMPVGVRLVRAKVPRDTIRDCGLHGNRMRSGIRCGETFARRRGSEGVGDLDTQGRERCSTTLAGGGEVSRLEPFHRAADFTQGQLDPLAVEDLLDD